VCANHKNGRAGWGDRKGCANSLRRPVAVINRTVLDWIQANVLREDLVAEVLEEVRRRLAERIETNTIELPKLTEEAQRLRAQLKKSAAVALEAPDAIRQHLFAEMSEQQERLSKLDARIRDMQA